MTQLNREEINASIKPYRRFYDELKKVHKRRVTSRQLKAKIRILRQAKSVLEEISPYNLGQWALELVKYRIITAIDVARLSHSPLPMHVLCIDEAIEYLSSLLTSGRPRNLVLGDCANALANLYKRMTGKFHWEEVGHVLAEWFPEALREDDGARDVRLWSLNLAKRSRRYQLGGRLGTLTLGHLDPLQSKPTFVSTLSIPGNYLARYSGSPKTDLMTAIEEFGKSRKTKD